MSAKDDTPAFRFDSHGEEHLFVMPAETLRQWYAGMAMEGIIRRVEIGDIGSGAILPEVCAGLAFSYADAMLKADSRP